MSTGIIGWEELRKQARILENDIDLKLVAFSKLSAGISTPSTSDVVPLLSGQHMIESMSLEIEQLLGKLSTVNEKMSEQPVSGAAMLHIQQRHRDILRELTREFRKSCSVHESRKEREDLLGGNGAAGSQSPGKDVFRNEGMNRRDLLLKESQHMHSSDRLVDEQISIAMETKEHLYGQRASFKRMQTRLNDLLNRFPALNGLVQRINLRKRRDSIVLGCIVSLCVVLLLFYVFD